MFLVVACGIFSCSMQTLSWGMWDLVPWPGIEPRPPALGVWSLNHWTPREAPTPLLERQLLAPCLAMSQAPPSLPESRNLEFRRAYALFHSIHGSPRASVWWACTKFRFCIARVSPTLSRHRDAAVSMANPWPGGVNILSLDILLSFICLVSSSCKNQRSSSKTLTHHPSSSFHDHSPWGKANPILLDPCFPGLFQTCNILPPSIVKSQCACLVIKTGNLLLRAGSGVWWPGFEASFLYFCLCKLG